MKNKKLIKILAISLISITIVSAIGVPLYMKHSTHTEMKTKPLPKDMSKVKDKSHKKQEQPTPEETPQAKEDDTLTAETLTSKMKEGYVIKTDAFSIILNEVDKYIPKQKNTVQQLDKGYITYYTTNEDKSKYVSVTIFDEEQYNKTLLDTYGDSQQDNINLLTKDAKEILKFAVEATDNAVNNQAIAKDYTASKTESKFGDINVIVLHRHQKIKNEDIPQNVTNIIAYTGDINNPSKYILLESDTQKFSEKMFNYMVGALIPEKE